MEFKDLRERMVQEQIVGRGIKDRRVIEVIGVVPRHEFVLFQDWERAYEDMPLSIGEGQTISQPFIVALMTEALHLKADDTVLEIGTGSGYQTAILSELCQKVYTIERIEALAKRAESLFKKLNYHNIVIQVGDGTLGWRAGGAAAGEGEDFLFDAILVTAAAPGFTFFPGGENPLTSHLKEGGRLVVPIGDRVNQVLTRMTKTAQNMSVEEICKCVFVPLIGKFGWER